MPDPAMLSGAFPVLVSVTVWVAEAAPDACGAKVSKVVLRLAIGPLAVPVTMPVSDTCCGLPLALSAIFNSAK